MSVIFIIMPTQCPTLKGLQDTNSAVADVKHFITVCFITKLQLSLQLSIEQYILPSLPSLANKICLKKMFSF